MARHAFAYTEFEIGSSEAFPTGYKTYRPLLQVEIVNGDKRCSCHAIVDSGADHCWFPTDLLQELGLDKALLPVGSGHGFGSDFNVHFKDNLRLELDQIGALLVHGGFSDSLNGGWNVGLLGQKGLLRSL
jgi:hypothetical protein